jgi:hypothetical protein
MEGCCCSLKGANFQKDCLDVAKKALLWPRFGFFNVLVINYYDLAVFPDQAFIQTMFKTVFLGKVYFSLDHLSSTCAFE